MQEKERPDQVPAAAWWSPEDNEWVLADKDPDGALHGPVRYWRPDGSLVCVCDHRHGTPHGAFKRFHETGEVSQHGTYADGQLHGARVFIATDGHSTEPLHANGLDLRVRRVEMDYEHGQFRDARYFNAAGQRVDRRGELLAARPDTVPADAQLNERNGNWMAGTWDEQGRKHGPMRVWDAEGRPVVVETHAGDLLHGLTEHFYKDGSVRIREHYAEGKLEGERESLDPDGTVRVRATYEDGVLHGAYETFGPRRRAVFHRGWVTHIEDPDGTVEFPQLEDKPLPVPPAADAVAVRRIHKETPDSLSPVGFAEMVAQGWGGESDRKRKRARAARAWVRAHADESLQAVLAQTGLDRAHRLMTPKRARQVVAAMEAVPQVDAVALALALARRDGPGGAALLCRNDVHGLDALRERVRGDGVNLNRLGLTQVPPTLPHLAVRRVELEGNALDAESPALGWLVGVHKLRLQHNNLTRVPPAIGRLTGLRALYLGDNQIEAVDDTLSQLACLEVLQLSDNPLRTLPDSFGRLQRLHTLWLNDTPLETLPASMPGMQSLTFLHLGEHPWATPPDVLWRMTQLEELWVASSSLRALPEDIGQLTRLRRLIIWYSGLETLPEALFEMTHLEELRVGNNPLPEGTIERLKEALPDCTIY